MNSECNLLTLPPELLRNILLKCSSVELVALSYTCRHLHEAVQDDSLWQYLAKKEYNVTENTAAVLTTYKKLYQRLLHPYGWMIGLYWSRIDYFGGLLEVKVAGDSLVAHSLHVTDAGVLEDRLAFEICAAVKPAKKMCSMIERLHATEITQCKDRQSIRQKCQFHDTKFAQGHYNYNTTEGFRAMTFIDAHRQGVVHQPLCIPPLHSIPREMWTTQPPNTLNLPLSMNSSNYRESTDISNSFHLIDSPRASSSSAQASEPQRSSRKDEWRQRLHGADSTESSSGDEGGNINLCDADSHFRRVHSQDNNINSNENSRHVAPNSFSCCNSPQRATERTRDQEALFRLVAQCQARCARTEASANSVDDQSEVSKPGYQNQIEESLEVSSGLVPKTSTSDDSLSACNNFSHSSTNDSINTEASQDSADLSSGSGCESTSAFVLCGARRKRITDDIGPEQQTDAVVKDRVPISDLRELVMSSNTYYASSIGRSLYVNNLIGSSRHELAQLYRETYCNPFSEVPDLKFSSNLHSARDGRLAKEDGDLQNDHSARTVEAPPISTPQTLFSRTLLLPPTLPLTLPPHVLKPGLYTAFYESHGYEVVLLQYQRREIVLIKILGDQYVPSKEVSVKIYLPYSFYLSAEQQRHITFEDLKRIIPQASKLPLSHYQQQPFILPRNCSVGARINVPSHCWARYHGFAQLANMFHSSPRFSPVHGAVFDNETLGVILLQLKTFMVFRRINRELTEHPQAPIFSHDLSG